MCGKSNNGLDSNHPESPSWISYEIIFGIALIKCHVIPWASQHAHLCYWNASFVWMHLWPKFKLFMFGYGFHGFLMQRSPWGKHAINSPSSIFLHKTGLSSSEAGLNTNKKKTQNWENVRWVSIGKPLRVIVRFDGAVHRLYPRELARLYPRKVDRLYPRPFHLSGPIIWPLTRMLISVMDHGQLFQY